MSEFLLTGPRGDNPLGFLTALGALVTLEDAGCEARLSWEGVWPRLVADKGPNTPEALANTLHESLRRKRSADAAETERAKKDFERAKTLLKKKTEEVKKRRLDREARDQELAPLETGLDEKHAVFMASLSRHAADPSVRLGKSLTVSNSKLIEHIQAACKEANGSTRRWADLTVSYGVADPAHPDDRMLATPWALVSGSGHQDFLSTIEELMIQCTVFHLNRALFGPWEPCDEMFSLRLDAAADRRYALMDGDPSPSRPRTLWGANRLAFEALRFFPTVPRRGGMGVRGWRATKGTWQDGCRVRWPLWNPPVGGPVVHSLLGLEDLWSEDLEARARLRLRGVRAVVESTRIAVGEGANKKYNVTPAVAVWTAPAETP